MLQQYAGLPPAAFRAALGPQGAIRTAPPDDNQRSNHCRLNEVLLEVVPDRLHRPLIEYTWEQLYRRPWMPGTAQGDLLLNGPQPTDADPLIRDSASQGLCMVSEGQRKVYTPVDVRHTDSTNICCVFPQSYVLIVQYDRHGAERHRQLHQISGIGSNGRSFELTEPWQLAAEDGQPANSAPVRQPVRVHVRDRTIRDFNTGSKSAVRNESARTRIWHGVIRGDSDLECDVTSTAWVLLHSSHQLVQDGGLKARLLDVVKIRNDLSGHIARASVTWDELCDALIRIIDLAVAIGAFMADEQLALEAQAAMCGALERSEKEFRKSVEKLVMQVAAQALNGSEAEACTQDPPTQALHKWLCELECSHPPKLYHTAERFFSCTGGAMHPALEPWMPRSKPGCTGQAPASTSCQRSTMSITVQPEGAKIEAHVGTLVVFGNNELIQQAIKAGSIVQGKQKDATHRWYIGLDDRTLDREHCSVFTDSQEVWFMQNKEPKHHTRIWDDTKAKFKRLGAGQTVLLPPAVSQRFQLGSRSKKGELSDHVIELQCVGPVGESSSTFSEQSAKPQP